MRRLGISGEIMNREFAVFSNFGDNDFTAIAKLNGVFRSSTFYGNANTAEDRGSDMFYHVSSTIQLGHQ